MDNGTVLEDAKKESAKNNEPVPREKVKPKPKEITNETTQESNTGNEPIPSKEESTIGEVPYEDSKGAEGEPPSEPPAEVAAEGGEGVGITHAQTADLRKEAGLPEYEKESETFSKWDAEAKERISKGEMPSVLEKMNKGDQPTAVEQRMMGFYIADLVSKVDADPSEANLNTLHEAIKLSDKAGGSVVGKSLVARKGEFLPENSLAAFFERERMVNNDAPLTESQKETVQQEHKDITEAEKAYQEKIAALESENAKLKAEQAVKGVKNQVRKEIILPKENKLLKIYVKN